MIHCVGRDLCVLFAKQDHPAAACLYLLDVADGFFIYAVLCGKRHYGRALHD